jgi:hypothetical protein
MSPVLELAERECSRCGRPAGRRFDPRLSVGLLLLGAVGTWWVVGWLLIFMGLWMWSRPAAVCRACRASG